MKYFKKITKIKKFALRKSAGHKKIKKRRMRTEILGVEHFNVEKYLRTFCAYFYKIVGQNCPNANSDTNTGMVGKAPAMC